MKMETLERDMKRWLARAVMINVLLCITVIIFNIIVLRDIIGDLGAILFSMGLLFIIIIVVIVVKRKGKPSSNLKVYEEKNKNLLQGVFQEDKKSYKLLLRACYLYECPDRVIEARVLLMKLLESCKTREDYIAVYTLRARCYMEEWDYKNAIEDSQRILEYDDYNVEARENIGYCYKKQGKMQEAIEAYESVLNYHSEDAKIYDILATSYGELSNPQAALKNALRALELDPGMVSSMHVAAWAYNCLGDCTSADVYMQMYTENKGKK